MLVAVAAFAGAAIVLRAGSRAALGLAGLCLAMVGTGFALWPTDGKSELETSLPTVRRDRGYVSSDACRSCHPGAYHAWRDSYHSTMTQAATPETVLADWEGPVPTNRGHKIVLERRGREFWAELPDPLWSSDRSPQRPEDPPRIWARVVMTTGSHHLQNYWLRRPRTGAVYRDSHDNGALVQLPLVWIIDEKRWAPGQDSFLTPPSSEPEPPLVWNTSCHLCHSVAASPGFDEVSFDTTAVELGIACESCHGPGQPHIEHHQAPWTRYLAYFSTAADPMIENAAQLAKDRSVEACGQCHSFGRVVDIPKWKREGVGYRPGDPLEKAVSMLRFSNDPQEPHLLDQLADEPNALVGRFWRDGTIRVAGREMNGIAESACFERGELTCLSCHSMHGYESPDDQLVEGGRGNGPCLNCHVAYAGDVAQHTRHATGSAGSVCANCHMPHTTYGLFKAIRSHRIDNPSAANSARTGRPNACNLCHLDRSLAWADAELQRGWGVAPANLTGSEESIAASVRWALSGDAAQRAITAWHLGWEPARAASGANWAPLYLAQLLSDPYAAVRRVARRSLQSQPGFETFEFDYLADPETLTQKSREAWERWRRASDPKAREPRAALLLDSRNQVDDAAFSRLLEQRDHTPLRIIE